MNRYGARLSGTILGAEPPVFGSVYRADLIRIAVAIAIAALLILLARAISRAMSHRWAGADHSARKLQRAATLAGVFRSLFTGVVVMITIFTVLASLGLDLAPFVAGASVVGVALGFGAQSIVKDFLAGAWMLIEDQFGVGDVIDTGFARGTVESVSLRTVTIRDQEGTVWHVPNGMIERIGNLTQQYSKAIVDIAVSADADLDQALATIQEAADSMYASEPYSEEMLQAPEVLGIESLGVDRITIRVVLTTQPRRQWDLARVLRERMVRALQQAGIQLPKIGPDSYGLPRPKGGTA